MATNKTLIIDLMIVLYRQHAYTHCFFALYDNTLTKVGSDLLYRIRNQRITKNTAIFHSEENYLDLRPNYISGLNFVYLKYMQSVCSK